MLAIIKGKTVKSRVSKSGGSVIGVLVPDGKGGFDHTSGFCKEVVPDKSEVTLEVEIFGVEKVTVTRVIDVRESGDAVV